MYEIKTQLSDRMELAASVKHLLDRIDSEIWMREPNKSGSLSARSKVEASTNRFLNLCEDDRLIQNGIATCDESVNHPKIWMAGECYMIVAINVTHSLSVIARYYVKSADADHYFTIPLPESPFTKLLIEHGAAVKVMEEAKAKVNALWARVQAECPHTHMEAKSNYVSGGYLDRAEYTRWLECDVCGHKTDAGTEQGGFG